VTGTRRWWTALAVIAIALAIGAVSRIGTTPGARSVTPLPLLPDAKTGGTFDPAHSAALFVGVREFEGDVSLVRYAVDDAVDLAYAFSLGGRSELVRPERVVLALSGQPQKEESRKRLQKLRAAKATITSATAEEVRALVEEQTARVASTGILILSFATHGFVGDDGVHYLLGRTSGFDAGSSLSAAQVLEVASKAARSLVLVDACRERVPSSSRSGDAGPRSTAPPLRTMTRTEGQAVFYAAMAGEYAFDDDEAMNGVFTRAVLEGLACKVPSARIVNADRLQRYVHKRVRDWVQKKRRGKGGIQASIDGEARLLPLANCHCNAPAAASEAWRASMLGPVAKAEAVDLDGDCRNETIVNAGGALHVFDANGQPRWKAGEPVREFQVGRPYSDRRPVLALFPDGFSVFDDEGNALSTVRRKLQNVGFFRPTTRHDNKIVATSGDTVLLFRPKDPIPLWQLRVTGTIEAIEILDYDDDEQLDLAVRMKEGRAVLDVDGHALNGAKVDRLPRK
jgi:hypothetical protein